MDGKNDISINDLDKLKRDCIAHNINKGVLIYPEINYEYEGVPYEVIEINKENFCEEVYSFSLEEYKMNI